MICENSASSQNRSAAAKILTQKPKQVKLLEILEEKQVEGSRKQGTETKKLNFPSGKKMG